MKEIYAEKTSSDQAEKQKTKSVTAKQSGYAALNQGSYLL
jgi:hypothetical protein